MGKFDPQLKTIAGQEWAVTPFPGRQSTEYKWALGKIVTPALSQLAPWIMPVMQAMQSGKGALDNILDMDIDLDVIPKVVATLMEHVAPKPMVQMMIDLMAHSTRDGVPVDEALFDREFAGNDGELYRALHFIVEVNWPDFTGWVGKTLTGLHPEMEKTEGSKKTLPSSAKSKS